MSLLVTIAAPFYQTRKKSLQRGELTFYYAYDKKWMDKDRVPLLLKRGIEQNLIKCDGEQVTPLFDISSVEIPIGYKPSSSVFEEDDPFQQVLDRIIGATGKSDEDIVSMMNSVIDDFDGHIRPEAAILIVAKQLGIRTTEFIQPLTEKILKNR